MGEHTHTHTHVHTHAPDVPYATRVCCRTVHSSTTMSFASLSGCAPLPHRRARALAALRTDCGVAVVDVRARTQRPISRKNVTSLACRQSMSRGCGTVKVGRREKNKKKNNKKKSSSSRSSNRVNATMLHLSIGIEPEGSGLNDGGKRRSIKLNDCRSCALEVKVSRLLRRFG